MIMSGALQPKKIAIGSPTQKYSGDKPIVPANHTQAPGRESTERTWYPMNLRGGVR
jgi:hypothetical protein